MAPLAGTQTHGDGLLQWAVFRNEFLWSEESCKEKVKIHQENIEIVMCFSYEIRMNDTRKGLIHLFSVNNIIILIILPYCVILPQHPIIFCFLYLVTSFSFDYIRKLLCDNYTALTDFITVLFDQLIESKIQPRLSSNFCLLFKQYFVKKKIPARSVFILMVLMHNIQECVFLFPKNI